MKYISSGSVRRTGAASMPVVLALVGALGTHVGPARADEAVIRKALGASMPDLKIESMRKLPKLEMYEVVVNGRNVLYVEPTGTTAFVGRMLDVQSKENLTEKRIQELLRVDFSGLPLDKAIVSVKGSGARKLAVFSDPDCPYCRQLEKELQGITDVTIYTFLYPLVSIHPDAPRKARLVWCAPDRAKAWDELMLLGREPDNGASCAAPINDNVALAQKLSIEGTPGIVFASGRLIPGLIQRAAIEQFLNEAMAEKR